MIFDTTLMLLIITSVTGLIFFINLLFFRGSRTNKPAWPARISKAVFPVLMFFLLLQSFVVEPFRTPTESMLPTLKENDYIVVNKFSYGLKLPLLSKEIVAMDNPERGEIIAFKSPQDKSKYLIKRIIGIPGDTVNYINRSLYINGEQVKTRFVEDVPPLKLIDEKLGNITHQALVSIKDTKEANGKWKIPEDNYFVMGDNRDSSSDSREWGLVPKESIAGKAFAIWMHWESFTSMPDFSAAQRIK